MELHHIKNCVSYATLFLQFSICLIASPNNLNCAIIYKPNVYSGGEDSEMFAEYVKRYCSGKSVLDMGCGTGIQAITAALNGAKKVIAVDVNSCAVKLTIENAKLNNVAVEVFESDLFSNVRGKFDLIVFNAPYLPLDAEIAEAKKLGVESDSLQWSGGKKIILEFLRQAKTHLNKNGIVLFVYSSLTKLPKIDGVKIIDKIHYAFEDIFIAQFQCVLRKNLRKQGL